VEIKVICCDFCGDPITKNNTVEGRVVSIIPSFFHPNTNVKIDTPVFNIDVFDDLFKSRYVTCCVNCLKKGFNTLQPICPSPSSSKSPTMPDEALGSIPNVYGKF
jgi:hypothetical protein